MRALRGLEMRWARKDDVQSELAIVSEGSSSRSIDNDPRLGGVPYPTNKDEVTLESLGYRQELKRDYSRYELFAMGFSLMSVAPSVASVLLYLIPAGGVGLTWGWFVPLILIMSIGVSLSEMASAMPTSGGLYWWTYKFAPVKLRSWLSFLTGYADTLGLIAGGGSATYGAAEQILSCAAMRNNYTASNGVKFAVYIGVLLVQLLIGSLPNNIVIRLQVAMSGINVASFCLLIIALPVGMHVNGVKLNSGDYVFGDTSNYTNYPYGMSFILTWMACIWSTASQDACIHMAEEASNAATAVPFGMLTSLGTSGLLGFVLLTVLTACMDPSAEGVAKLMDSSTPMAIIIERGLNKNWAIGFMALFSFMLTMMGMSSLMTTSRQVYAFARDDALPFSRWLKRTTKNQLPVPGLIFTIVIAALLGLLILAGDVAANAIFSLAMSSLYLAWSMPIFCYALSSQRITEPGPFYLGHFASKLNARIASAFGFLVIFCVSMMPANIPVSTADGMNYTCVVCGAVWFGATLYWLIDARKWYNGPKSVTGDVPVIEVLEAVEKNEIDTNLSDKELKS